MKKLIFVAAMLFTIGLCAVSCSKDLDIDQAIALETKLQTRLSINPDHLAALESLGYNIEEIVEMDDCYIVEGDMAIDKSYLSELASKPQTRQARWGDLPTWKAVSDVRVSTFALANNEWKAALIEAMNAWNNIPYCTVFFRHVHGNAGEVYVNMDSTISGVLGSETAAYANMPVGGAPGVGIRINPAKNGYSHEEKIYVMVHELGHVVGLGHTDYAAEGEQQGYSGNGTSHIPGTPYTEGNSVMHHAIGTRDWVTPVYDYRGNPIGGSFTKGDVLAIQQLYGAPDYAMKIMGPNVLGQNLLYPGETITLRLLVSSALSDYTRNIRTTWETNEEIVSQNDTLITIRCNHPNFHEISVKAICNYNDQWFDDTIILNGGQGDNAQGLRSLLAAQGFHTWQIDEILNGSTYERWRFTAKEMNTTDPGIVDYIFDDPGSLYRMNLRTALRAQGPTEPAINTTTTYTPPNSLPDGISFFGYSHTIDDNGVEGVNFTSTGGSNNSLIIKYLTYGKYSVDIRYLFPNNEFYTVSKPVNLPPPNPVLSVNKLSAAQGETVTFTVTNHRPGVTYNWYVEDSTYPALGLYQVENDSHTYTRTFGTASIHVNCVAVQNDATSFGSNFVEVIPNSWVPVISSDKTSASNGETVTFIVDNPCPGVKYEWYVVPLLNNVITFSSPSFDFDWELELVGDNSTFTTTMGNNAIKVYCKMVFGNNYELSVASNSITVSKPLIWNPGGGGFTINPGGGFVGDGGGGFASINP